MAGRIGVEIDTPTICNETALVLPDRERQNLNLSLLSNGHRVFGRQHLYQPVEVVLFFTHPLRAISGIPYTFRTKSCDRSTLSTH